MCSLRYEAPQTSGPNVGSTFSEAASASWFPEQAAGLLPALLSVPCQAFYSQP